MTLQVVSLIRPSKNKQQGTQNNRSWLSTCSQVNKPWLMKIQHGKPCHTLLKLDVFLVRDQYLRSLLPYGDQTIAGQLEKHVLESMLAISCETRLNPIRPGGGGGSEARMAKLTAANQKPLIQ